ncbi:hypothetical protein [Pseudalkalibacillus sp. SCS-8]|uniref:hypothetical protein n=1 Tax=Pseudalkalibacillus nanhaiensis TaxID=3115291 RepID=UPI0032DBABF6
MKNHSSLRYLLFLFGYGVLIMLGFQLESQIQIRAEKHFLLTPVFYYSILFPIVIGILMAIPLHIQSLRNRNSWHLNWRKLIIFGIPSLLILLFPAYYFTLLAWGDVLGFADLLFGNDRLHFLSGIVLGFTIINSIEVRRPSEE